MLVSGRPAYETPCSIRVPPYSAPAIVAPSLSAFVISTTALTIQLQIWGVKKPLRFGLWL